MDKLRKLFESQLVPALEKLDEQRKGVVTKLLTAIVLWLVLVSVSLPLLNLNLQAYLLTLAIIAAIAWYYWDKTYYEPYRQSYTQQIIEPLAACLLPKFKYYPEAMIQRDLVADSDLTGIHKSHPKRGEVYAGGHYFDGMVDKTRLRFSQLKITEQRGTSKNRSTVTLFSGLFLVLDFHKHLSGHTLLLRRNSRRSAEKYFGSFFSSKALTLTTNNPQFNQTFAAYTDDRLEARYVLSENLMERILQLSDDVKQTMNGKTPSFCFKDEKLLIAIPLKRELFAPRLFSLRKTYEHFASYQRILHFIRGTVDELNMNRRIWTKE